VVELAGDRVHVVLGERGQVGILVQVLAQQPIRVFVRAIRERIPGATSSISQGVAVEVGERQAAVDLDVMVEYGVAIADLAEGIRRNVITAIEAMTGLEVTEVNITVDDIHLPDDEDSDDGDTGRGTRVQ